MKIRLSILLLPALVLAPASLASVSRVDEVTRDAPSRVVVPIASSGDPGPGVLVDPVGPAGFDLGGPGGPRVVERDGDGIYSLTLIRRDPSGAIVSTTRHPSSTWTCAEKVVVPFMPIGGIIRWSGCQVPDPAEPTGLVQGDFDVHMLVFLSPEEVGATDVEVWVDNRMPHAIEEFRFIFRVDPTSLPADPSRMYVLYGYDEWIPDPLVELGAARVNIENVHVQQAYVVESAARGSGFYRNRLKTTSTYSVHNEDWGLLFYGTDPANADMGWILQGANPDDAGNPQLEFGYEFRMPLTVLPGNGNIIHRVGPRFRTKVLPAARPLESAWWEAVDAYRPYLLESPLLPEAPLTETEYPTGWARDCLYAAWSVSAVGQPIDVDLWEDLARRIARYYRTNPGGSGEPEAITICPLLWGALSNAPFEPRPGALELLARLQVVAQEEGVDYRPGVYMYPTVFDWDRAGEELRGAAMLDENGNPIFTAPGIALAREDDPAMLAEVTGYLEEISLAGNAWVYHDAPFGEWLSDPGTYGGPFRQLHVGIQTMVQAMADTVTALGGGVVVIEQGRMGLNAVQSAGSALSVPMYLKSTPVPFTKGLWHDYHLNGFFGDILGEPLAIMFGDSRWDEQLGACPTCPFKPGLPDNYRHIPRLAFDGAVEGTMAFEPVGEYFELDPATANEYELWLIDYVEAMRKGLHLRRETAALRTGVLLPTPPSDIGTVQIAARGVSYTPPALFKEVAIRTMPELPAAFYRDVESEGELVIVVGNPTREARSATFWLSVEDYDEMSGAYAAFDEEGNLLVPAGTELEITVELPPLEFRVVTLRPAVTTVPIFE